jgi:hypothetical protein
MLIIRGLYEAHDRPNEKRDLICRIKIIGQEFRVQIRLPICCNIGIREADTPRGPFLTNGIQYNKPYIV